MKTKKVRQPKIKSTLVPADRLLEWGMKCLQAVGLARADARLLASSLVQTSLWGIDSHGVARLGHYLTRLTIGSIESRPKMRLKRTGPCTAQLDGGHGHGILICHRAMDEAIALARKNGVGVVGVSNSTHGGAIGLYGRKAAAKGMISIGFTHSDAFVAPHGGREKFFGTNPICITIPTSDPKRPLCFDMATSATTYNRVVNYRRENRPLTLGWALDAKGRPTTDAHAATALLPLAGHKGYGLALMIDLLCGPLNGMPFGPHIPIMYAKLTRRRRLGSFFIAIDPRRFAGGRAMAAMASRCAREAKAQPRADKKVPILVPGDPELNNAVRRAREGIPVEPGLREEINRWSEKLGVPAP